MILLSASLREVIWADCWAMRSRISISFAVWKDEVCATCILLTGEIGGSAGYAAETVLVGILVVD